MVRLTRVIVAMEKWKVKMEKNAMMEISKMVMGVDRSALLSEVGSVVAEIPTLEALVQEFQLGMFAEMVK